MHLRCILTKFSPAAISSLSQFHSMSRRSPCKKVITPEVITTSDNEDFVAVASDHSYVASCFFILCPLLTFSCFISYSPDGKDVDDLRCTDDESESEQDHNRDKNNAKLARSVGKKRAPTPAVESEDDDV